MSALAHLPAYTNEYRGGAEGTRCCYGGLSAFVLDTCSHEAAASDATQ